VPFITLHYRNIGLDPAQIGVLLLLAGIVQIASPSWGLLADTLRIRRALLPIVIVGATPPAVVLSSVTDFWFIFALVVITSMFTAPMAPLADSATLAARRNARERYGSQQVLGAVG
jgi:predicted MFS family arabinose efflux permease